VKKDLCVRRKKTPRIETRSITPEIVGDCLMSQQATATPTINVELIKAFMNSVKNVLSTMAGITLQLEKPHLKNNPLTTYDVSGIVGFSGDVIGSVVVSFHRDAAVKIVERFSGMKIDVDNADFPDAIGELCNMIAGNAKKDFGLDASITIPNVLIGPNHTVSTLRDVPSLVIPCSCEYGGFAVEVNIKQVNGAGAKI
jgi:chemotaxis protein CheX